MISIEPAAWDAMVSHAQKTYPNECCGAMIGSIDGSARTSRRRALGERLHGRTGPARYELRQEDLLRADSEARQRGMDLIGTEAIRN